MLLSLVLLKQIYLIVLIFLWVAECPKRRFKNIDRKTNWTIQFEIFSIYYNEGFPSVEINLKRKPIMPPWIKKWTSESFKIKQRFYESFQKSFKHYKKHKKTVETSWWISHSTKAYFWSILIAGYLPWWTNNC